MSEEVYLEVHFTLCVTPEQLAEVFVQCRQLEPRLNKIKVNSGARNNNRRYWAGGSYGSDIELSVVDWIFPEAMLFEVNGLIANYTISDKARSFLSFLCDFRADARIWMEEAEQKTTIVLAEGIAVD